MQIYHQIVTDALDPQSICILMASRTVFHYTNDDATSWTTVHVGNMNRPYSGVTSIVITGTQPLQALAADGQYLWKYINTDLDYPLARRAALFP